ncbi:MAG: DUF4906 domain-containing protein [Bacteroides sp.]|nr:DUF4906 domain-containing protein [Bacteroides sp.]
MKLFHNTILLSLLLSLVGGISVMSCSDDLLYDNSLIGEGEADLSATLTFNPMKVGLDTRSSGTAINSFNEVCVVMYTTDGKFFKKFMANGESDYKYEQSGNTSYPTDYPTGHPGGDSDSDYDNNSQASTPEATFSFKNIPYGKYKIYAVANLGMLPDDVTESETALKSYRVQWSENVAQNNSMFGYFTLDNDKRSLGFNAPEIVVNSSGLKLHCWMKRTVSKVTIAFDPSGLKDAVSVFIKSVTIHDIPKECTLGEENEPKSMDDLNENGETIWYGDGKTSNVYTDWMKLQNGTGVQGAKNHTESDEALYFYENMQGNYEGQKDFLKQQIKDETGTSINEPETDSDGNVLENENGNMKTDFKDRVRYGTYIEVEGYYLSQNSEKLSKGPIKYRFMLGQNTTYNYNSERNCHYKLTLKFRGWANQPDWHIVYEDIEPSIVVPDPYYISYLYNQSMTYPVRVTGMDYVREHNLHLHAQIIKNNWIPTVQTTGELADEIVGTYDNIDGFAWNKWAYEHVYNGANYAGFLSLRENKQVIVGPEETYGEAGNTYLRENYEGRKVVSPRYYADYEIQNVANGLGVSGSVDDGLYDVEATDDNSVTIKLPMFTRPKELIPASDFSGNNPFYAYVREAVVRFSLRKNVDYKPSSSTAAGWSGEYDESFKIRDKEGKEQEVKYVDVTIYQVPRIVNPKAIWRRYNSTEPFHVELKQLDAAGATKFHNFKSDGPWRASILTDPDGLIKLTKDSQEVTNSTASKYIEGDGDTEIVFDYTPNGTTSATNARCGIILVEYHDYTCNHLIFVRQGYDKGMQLGDASWSCYNAYCTSGDERSTEPEDRTSTNVIVTNSPLSIGSYFKRSQYNYAILEKNEINYGWLASVENQNLETAYTNTSNSVTTRNATWDTFGGYAWTQYSGSASRFDKHWAETWVAVNKSNQQLVVPTYDQYTKLRDNCEYGYGVVYADGAEGVADNVADAYGYTNYDNASGTAAESKKGMRACLVYNPNNADHIIFPIGAIGQGRRARQTNGTTYRAAYNGTYLANITYSGSYNGAGALTYSSMRGLLYSNARSNGRSNNDRPLTYNLYREPGALYWFYSPVVNPNSTDSNPNVAAWDINYYTLAFNPYSYVILGENPTNYGGSSDALPIRLIYK